MTYFTIPVLPSVPFQTLKTTLDGVSYNLDLHWNRRAEVWFLDLLDAGRAPLLHGRPVLVRTLPLRAFHHLAGVPPGEILVFDTEDRDQDPGLDDFGTRVQLVYQDRAELEAANILAEAVR